MPSRRSIQYAEPKGIKPTGPRADRLHSRPTTPALSFWRRCRSRRLRPIRRRATSGSARRRPAGRSSSCIAAPTTRWTRTYEAITNYLDEKNARRQGHLHRGIRRRPAEKGRRQSCGHSLRADEMMRALALLICLLLPLGNAVALDRLVTVTGEGTVSVPPDMATLHLGVTTQAASAREASDANARRMTALLTAIKSGRHRGERHPDQLAIVAAANGRRQHATHHRLSGLEPGHRKSARSVGVVRLARQDDRGRRE